MHSYRLAPYQGPKSRHTCPSCQQPRQFVRYINTQTGAALGEHVGRCNRESKCGNHYTPRQYFAAHGLKSNPTTCSTPATPSQHPAAPTYIDDSLFQQSLQGYEKHCFTRYLTTLFGPEQIRTLMAQFYISTSKRWPGATIFWQIDLAGRIRTGKIMLYDPQSGKRVKTPYNHIDWVHKQLKQGPFAQCLFGLPQLRGAPKDQVVGLVESEKTAVIASDYLPAWLWLGVGSLHQLSPERCAMLRGRKVVLFPDVGGWSKWQDKAKGLEQALGSPVLVSDWLERFAGATRTRSGH